MNSYSRFSVQARRRSVFKYVIFVLSFVLICLSSGVYHKQRPFKDNIDEIDSFQCSYRPPTRITKRISYKTKEEKKTVVVKGNQLGQMIYSKDGGLLFDSFIRDYLISNYEKYYGKKKASQSFQIILALTEESSFLKEKVSNTLDTMNFFQKSFNVRVVYFTASQSIIQKCEQLGIDVVTQYITNYKGLPIVREMYTVSRSLYQAQYYGYLNSDILLSPSLIPVLEKLSQSYQQGELTDGFLVAGVPFNIPIPQIIPLTSPLDYALFINSLSHKQNFRSRGCSDFWIFHHTMDFNVLSDVVTSRIKVDTYIMSLLYTLKHSVVDATYSIIALHQGTEDFNQRNVNNSDMLDLLYNEFFVQTEGIPDFMLSRPGDRVIYWDDQRLILERWNSDHDRRERQREELIRSIRTSVQQYPNSF